MTHLLCEWPRLRESRLASDTGWLFAGQCVSILLQAAYFIVLARLLGAVEYGIFIGAFAFTSILAQYSSLGSGMVLLRYVSIDHKSFGGYWGNVLLSTFVLGALFTALLLVLAHHVLNTSSASLVLLASIGNCVCAQLTSETGRVFRAFEKMRVTAGLNILTNLMRTLAAGGMLLTIHRATAWQWVLASTVVSALAAVIAVGVVTVHFGPPQFSPRLFARHGIEGFGYSFAQSTTSLYNDVDKTMLSHYGMNEANGIYTMAYRVVDMATMPIFSIQDAALPRFFQRGRSGLSPASELSTRLLKRAAPLGVLSAAAMFVAAPLIPHFVGHGFAESVAALRWLCLIPVFRSVHNMTGAALTGAGLQGYRTTAQMTAVGINVGLNLWLIPRFGWLGAAWSSLVTDAALGGMNWGLLRFHIRNGK